jgi:hypothetical protein
MMSFAMWLRNTYVSELIRYYPWLWPVCETIHFIGLALVIGIAGMFDLRLMGFMSRISVSAIKDLMPWAIAGFAMNLATGTIFFVGAPDQYVNNPAWWAKVFFIVLAGLNAMVFETTLGARVLTLGPGEKTPASFKIIGAVSLFSWLSVLYWGRMLPFIGGAF